MPAESYTDFGGMIVLVADTLKFTPELTEQIVNGQKTNTVRLEQKNLKPGDYARLETRYDAERVSAFAVARIDCVMIARLGAIPLHLRGHEPYPDRQAQLDDYRRFYGPGIDLDTVFTIYFFTVEALLPADDGS